MLDHNPDNRPDSVRGLNNAFWLIATRLGGPCPSSLSPH